MRNRPTLTAYAFLACGLLTLTACNLPAPGAGANATQSTLPRAAEPSVAPTSPAAFPQPEHRIAIAVKDGRGTFYDRQTGQPFVPRGMNYVRLAWQSKADGSRVFGHSLFDPGQYDSSKAAEDLSRMHGDGYNTVRVFLSPDTMGTESGGLSTGYMQNVADFLGLARSNGIYVMFTLDWIPGGKYGQILNQDCCTTFALMNANFLPPAGLKANQVFYQDFVGDLMQRQAPVENIFSYELRNEMFYDSDQPPLSLSSGKVTTANGQAYDMSSAADKARMLDENLVYWIDSMRSAILKVDPTALVSVGFFHPQSPNPARIGDPRIAVTRPAIWQSQADFVDLHAYPGYELTLQQYVANFGIDGEKVKPIIMGEFGGEVARFASLETANQRFVDWQEESCKYGFSGWLFWTWNLTEQPDFFNARMGDGQIERALAPVTRPDPCSAAAGAGRLTNLALHAAAIASQSLPDQAPANAVDGNPESQWGAGSHAPQWIQIDLGKPSAITAVRLTVAQYPAGDTVHQIWAGAAQDSLKLIHGFDEATADNQVLEFRPPTPINGIRYLRILTTSSPSWVAWREVEVLGQ